MIGLKSLAAVGLAGGTVAVAASRGTLAMERLVHLSAASAFAIGLGAGAGAALVGMGWRPRVPSKAGLGRDGWRPALVTDVAPEAVRELPALVQLALVAIAFASIGAGTFTNEATARLVAMPSALAEPSRAEYCPPPGVAAAAAAEAAAAAAEEDEAPPPPPVDQAGCALVKRAFELGYAKDLGTCAPDAGRPKAAPRAAKVAAVEEVCERRQRDEPFAHFAWRRVVATASGASPGSALGDKVEGLRTRFDYVEDLLADVEHSVTGTPHASHHLWVSLPDPHPGSWRQRFTGHEPCSSRFADLPLWPRWTEASPPGAMVEHVLGQLLFATRFGTTASCSDYTIHWNAPVDACARLTADPTGFLDDSGALDPIRGVLDRRRRQQALRALAADLGEEPTMPEPPPARAVVSLSCFVIDPALAAAPAGPVRADGHDVVLDGEPIAVREVRAPAVRATGAGPIDVYVRLALLLGGRAYAGPAADEGGRLDAEPPGPLTGGELPLLALEPLVDADPFLGVHAALERADVVEVYPFEPHLKGFVDAFRRVYLPQRGRL